MGMIKSLKELQEKSPVPEKYLSRKKKAQMREGEISIKVKERKKKIKRRKMYPLQHRLFTMMQNMGYLNEQILEVVLGKKDKKYLRKGAILQYPKQMLTISQIEQLWHMVSSELTLNEFLFDYLKFGETPFTTETEFNYRMAKLLYEPTGKMKRLSPKRVLPRNLQKKVREAFESFKEKPTEEKIKESCI